jgi:chondroitin AC lyase
MKYIYFINSLIDLCKQFKTYNLAKPNQFFLTFQKILRIMYFFKKWSFLISFIFLLLPVRAQQDRASQSDELMRLKQNYIQSLLSSNSETKSLEKLLNAVVPETEISDQSVSELQQRYPFDLNKIEKYLQAMDTNGSWKDINYKDKKRSGWEPKVHAERVLELSKLYSSKTTPYYHSEKIASAIHLALHYWFTAKPVCLNWWYNQIGIPKTLGDAFILFEDQLTAEEKAEAIQVMGNSRFGMTGQNKVWLAGNVLVRGMLQNNFVLVKAARDTILSEIVTNKPEGIKSDWSFHQHGPQQQFGNYGLSFISDMSFYSGLFSGTSLALNDRQLHVLSSFINDGYHWVIWHGYMDINAINRQLFHNASIDKAFSVAFSATELAKNGLPACKNAAENILKDCFSSKDNENTFVGNKHFWDSDLTIHRRPKWMASVKMASERVIGTELVNEDNLKGFYMADGATYVYVNGDEYLNIFPLWDWRKIPGITSYESNLPVTNLKNGRNKSTFVGGVTDGLWGMTAMEINRDGLQARKSWIFTDNFVLCLGTDIKSDSALAVTTSIDQRIKHGNFLHLNHSGWSVIDGTQTFTGKEERFFHDNTGYITLEPEKCIANTGKRTGQWHDFMGMYEPKPVEGEIISLHLYHGISPKNSTYQYVIIPATDQKGTAAFDVSTFQIVQNDENAQAVSMSKDRVYWVTAYKPVKLKLSGNLQFSAESSGIYMIRQTKDGYELWCADPTHSQINASVKVNGISVTIALPTDEMKGKSVCVKISK